MANLDLYDRVAAYTATTGTGTLTLGATVQGYQSFAVVGNATTCYYFIENIPAGEWEVGSGTYTAAGTTLSRTAVLASSNSNNLVSLTGPQSRVVLTAPGSKILTTTSTQTVQNKTLDNTNTATFKDNQFNLHLSSDASKSAFFRCIDLTAQRLFTLPDGDTTFLGTALTQTVQNKTLDTTNTIDSLPNHNLLINGDFRIVQRGAGPFTSATTPANNDDTYLLDNWILLSDGNDIVDVSQVATPVPTGAYSAIALDVETANKKFGILQILEARDAVALIGGVGSLSFSARVTNSSIANIRAAILSWSSTADSPTSDVVSAWNAAGSDPTLVANWTYENTPSSLAMTTSYQDFQIENINIDTASTTNVAVFLWCDDVTTTVGDFLYISKVKLEAYKASTAWVETNYQEEWNKATRHFERVTTEAGNGYFCPCYSVTTDIIRGGVKFQPKRITPTLSMSAASTWAAEVGGANRLPSTVSVSNATKSSCRLNLSSLDFATVTGVGGYVFDNSATAYVDATAEL